MTTVYCVARVTNWPIVLASLALISACDRSVTLARDFDAQREQMVKEQIAARGVKDEKVLGALRNVPRHEFVPEKWRAAAYDDGPLPIGHDQTISQPYIVALMTEQLKPQPNHRILEIGTGSGYQAAVLSGLVADVYTIEIVEPLAKSAEATLQRLGYKNVHVKAGDGYKGWPEHAPFDSIIVTCAPDHVPQPLVDQLKEGGRMVIPVGPRLAQELYIVQKQNGQMRQTALIDVRFVPMTGDGNRRE
ncbi:MAG TPA: protein-L-isoaspartate(D-aspartate) O-methyltransferase [Chthoniobacterales bacterium]|nr:protein-L-isoaspartate(D-aspartate) O-methyltransferase [Chthoniobacterales bacterium]